VPLDAGQTEVVREILDEESLSEVESLLDDLTAEQEAATVTDVARWELIRDKHLKVSGGRDGVDLDYEREREAIRRRVSSRLGVGPESLMPTFFTAARGCRGR